MTQVAVKCSHQPDKVLSVPGTIKPHFSPYRVKLLFGAVWPADNRGGVTRNGSEHHENQQGCDDDDRNGLKNSSQYVCDHVSVRIARDGDIGADIANTGAIRTDIFLFIHPNSIQQHRTINGSIKTIHGF